MHFVLYLCIHLISTWLSSVSIKCHLRELYARVSFLCCKHLPFKMWLGNALRCPPLSSPLHPRGPSPSGEINFSILFFLNS